MTFTYKNVYVKDTSTVTGPYEKDGPLEKYFDKEHFFIKLSPINKNETSDANNLGDGIIEGINLV